MSARFAHSVAEFFQGATQITALQPGGFGTVYKMTPAGAVTILHNFDETSGGRNPSGGLVQGTDGNFYGVTFSSGEDHGFGLIFQITSAGTYNTIYEGFSYPKRHKSCRRTNSAHRRNLLQ